MASSQRIFHQLAARGGLMTAAPAGVALWAFGPIAALGAGAAVAGLELRRVRGAVRAGMPATLEFVPSRPADHPWLDADGFRDALGALETEGFRPVADYAVVYPKAPQGLARVLLHGELRIYAEVNQLRAKGHVTSVATTLTSMLDDGWSLQTRSQEPFPVSVAFMRAERALWRSLPGASAAELLADHTALRDRVCADLGVTVGGDGSLEQYFVLQQADHQAHRSALLSTNVVRGIARGIAAERRPRRQWLGAYRPSQPA
jgi:hypothetical protein